MKTRKEFLEAVMKMTHLKDLKQADDAARAVISLTKGTIGEDLSQKGHHFGVKPSNYS